MTDDVVSFRAPLSQHRELSFSPPAGEFRAFRDGPRDINEGVRRRLEKALRRLQRGEEFLEDEPDRASELIRAALGYARIGQNSAQDAIARIYLTVLTEQGLAAALPSLVSIFAIPVTLDVVPARFAQPVEAAAYFLIAETLTIAGEQTDATRAHVAAHIAGTNVVIEVSFDDVCEPGTTGRERLALLQPRVEAFDGTLQVVAQPGIGTRLRATFAPVSGPAPI
ncbi:MAG TPA: hypothetical protein VH373_21105 [Jatrophihabitantaceae bacterium]|jgi:signal transduction histidine kinase